MDKFRELVSRCPVEADTQAVQREQGFDSALVLNGDVGNRVKAATILLLRRTCGNPGYLSKTCAPLHPTCYIHV